MDRPKATESEIFQVNNWIKNISETGQVAEIEPMLLRSVLGEYGADFEYKPEIEALAKYSNLNKRPGLDVVWGKENVDAYKKWTKEFAQRYEQETGKPLPTLEGTDIKTSGMIQFFGELTAYAAGKLDFENYKRLTEDRARKGILWQEKDKNEPVAKSPNASFPPKFPSKAWEFIQTWKEK